MKIGFEWNDNLPLGKILSIFGMTIVVSSVFQEDQKYYLQAFLDECVYQYVGYGYYVWVNI